MSNTTMSFPDTIEEYMEIYKIVDSDEVYTNGVELVPVFRIKQWLKAHPNTVEVVRCKDCAMYKRDKELAEANYCDPNVYCGLLRTEMNEDGYCSYGRRKDE